MHRNTIRALLRARALCATDPHEQAMTAAVPACVEAQPACLERSCAPGHLTGSAWIVDRPRRRVLLTHHRKLDRWLQLGGHADGDADLLAVAVREAQEESGLASIRVLSPELFDVDVHLIPARREEPAHLHHDLRFLLEADGDEPLVISAESKDLAWVEIDRLPEYSTEESLLRMARKTPRLR
jgi:8-oxo-dGTP pyrophosphatase MutT (NUDIX family)